MIGFLLFTLFPLLFSVYASFTNWNGISAPVFKGLDNYTKMFGDRYFLKSLWNTLFMMIGIPVGLVISLALALAMNRKMRGTTFFRTVYYLPVISSIAAVAILWQWAFNGDFGLINQGLALIGIDGPNWLQDTATVKPALIIMAVWKGLGYSMLLYLAALQSVPRLPLRGGGAGRRHRLAAVPPHHHPHGPPGHVLPHRHEHHRRLADLRRDQHHDPHRRTGVRVGLHRLVHLAKSLRQPPDGLRLAPCPWSWDCWSSSSPSSSSGSTAATSFRSIEAGSHVRTERHHHPAAGTRRRHPRRPPDAADGRPVPAGQRPALRSTKASLQLGNVLITLILSRRRRSS